MNPLPVLFVSLSALTLAGCSTESSATTSERPAGADPAAMAPAVEASTTPARHPVIYDVEVAALDGDTVDLAGYEGKVSLFVNVASECGYTRQYTALQELHDEYADRGFQVLGFPCNDFGGQEPGTAEQIRAFCTDNYGVTFPMFAKVAIKGSSPAPVYARLVEATGETPTWNFCKYLVGKNGQVLRYWGSGTAPADAELRAAIESAL